MIFIMKRMILFLKSLLFTYFFVHFCLCKNDEIEINTDGSLNAKQTLNKIPDYQTYFDNDDDDVRIITNDLKF